MDKYLKWGKTSLLAQQNKIDYVIFESPSGDRYGKVIGWRENDKLVVLTVPVEGGDERIFLVQSKNYPLYHTKHYFNCEATITPIKYSTNGFITIDGDSTETRIWFELFEDKKPGFWWVVILMVIFYYLLL